jgi:cation:H+ antiporter
VAGAELLVRGASRLAAALGVSRLVIGLTVVAYGTSTPELAVTLQAAFQGQAALSIGNVIGSNIFNVLVVLGLSAAILPLVVSHQLVRLDVPIMIAISLLLPLLSLDGRIDWLDGLLLFVLSVGYTVFAIYHSRRQNKLMAGEDGSGRQEDDGVEHVKGFAGVVRQLLLVVVGLFLLVIGSGWLVDGAVAIARMIGVSELIIALTIVAAGTSLPEVATSVIAVLKGERDIAVGNVVGSNIYNILSVLGMAGLLAPDAIPVPVAAIRFDIPVMIAVTVACLPIFFTGHAISRPEGILFLAYYGAYTIYLALDSTGHDTLPVFSSVMALFVMPLTIITLFVLYVRARRAASQRS